MTDINPLTIFLAWVVLPLAAITGLFHVIADAVPLNLWQSVGVVELLALAIYFTMAHTLIPDPSA